MSVYRTIGPLVIGKYANSGLNNLNVTYTIMTISGIELLGFLEFLNVRMTLLMYF